MHCKPFEKSVYLYEGTVKGLTAMYSKYVPTTTTT